MDQSNDQEYSDLVRKYMLAKMSGQQDPQVLAQQEQLENNNLQLERMKSDANFSGALNTASAMIGGNRAKADNTSLEAANKDRSGQIATNNQTLAAGQAQSSKEREDAIKEYLSGQRSKEIQDRMLSINANNTDLRRELGNQSTDTKFAIQDLKNQLTGATAGKKDEQKMAGYIQDLGKELTYGPPRAGQDFQRHVAKVSAANALLTLGEQGDYQKNGLDSRQIHEAAIAAGALVGGGSTAAQNTVNSLVPHSAGPVESRIEEWLTNEPHGANQIAFVDRMLETAKREKHLATESLRNYRAQSIDNNTPKLIGSDAGNKALESYKAKYLSGAKYDENGNYQMAPYAQTLPPEIGSVAANRNSPLPNSGPSGTANAGTGPVTKTIGNDVYEKVEGGWKRRVNQ